MARSDGLSECRTSRWRDTFSARQIKLLTWNNTRKESKMTSIYRAILKIQPGWLEPFKIYTEDTVGQLESFSFRRAMVWGSGVASGAECSRRHAECRLPGFVASLHPHWRPPTSAVAANPGCPRWWATVVIMLARRRLLWPNIKPTSV